MASGEIKKGRKEEQQQQHSFTTSTSHSHQKCQQHARHLLYIQIFNLICVLLFYGYSYNRIWMLESRLDESKHLLARRVNKRDTTRVAKNANPRSSEMVADVPEQWAIFEHHDAIIPKKVFETSCQRMHNFCAEKGKKLRGPTGPPGAQGEPGPRGPPGMRGPQGRMGRIGAIGESGEQGETGADGRCNCSLPDLYVQRIPVPGPPMPVDKLIPVPVVVLKEVEVTKLVPFEPTPPGFAPPLGWSPGMPMVDSSQTRLLPPPGHPTPPLPYRFWWTRPWRKQRPTSSTASTPPTTVEVGQNGMDAALSPNKTSNRTKQIPTTTPPYTGPPTLSENQRECRLNAVGIPVLHAESQFGHTGSWFRDSLPRDDKWSAKRWVTDSFASPVLYEYENEKELLNKKQNIKYYMDFLASGTGNIIHNGSYYYHRHGSNILVRYELDTTQQIQSDSLGPIASLDCPRKRDQSFEECNETDRQPWLYNRSHNYVDFAPDENGIWVIYMRPGRERLLVSKMDEDLRAVETWELDVNGTELADAFIMCGVIYGLESANERDTYISFAFDLYRNESIFIDVPWYNPYGGLTQLSYNSADNRLYFFDSGKLLSVNVRMEPEYYDEQDVLLQQ